jgi:CHAT domain-containing protein
VYSLKLGADLVVLSGCETALGREIRGEGLVGLTQGFFYAGSERVMASLWRVEDRATAELMSHFYRAMLKQGLPPAAALRSAQLAIRSDARWQDPFFWAPFVLQGDWR